VFDPQKRHVAYLHCEIRIYIYILVGAIGSAFGC
jgi:hypothetical protein